MRASAPEAPPLSETTIGCFIRLFFWIAACIIRAIWSEAPPAPAATTISTGFVGSHAAAGAVRANVDARAHKLNRIRASAMVLSSLLSFLGDELFRETGVTFCWPERSIRHSDAGTLTGILPLRAILF